MPPSSPQATSAPAVKIIFSVDGVDKNTGDVGALCNRFEFYSRINGGYMVRATFNDANFNILKKYFIELEYLTRARSATCRMKFSLSWPKSDNKMPSQEAYVINSHVLCGRADIGDVTFDAVDPPTWFLNCGNSSGKAYHGKVSDVITQCVAEYAPQVDFSMTKTTDSDQNTWWMMRQDPRMFIRSLLDWSGSLSPRRGQWIVGVDGQNMQIREQLEVPSNNVGFYSGPHREGQPHISEAEMLSENALSLMATRLTSSGISAVSGQYFDVISQPNSVSVSDKNTDAKYKANVGPEKAFTKPQDSGPPKSGWTAISTIPELYSAGDIGKKYGDYIDGRARQMFLNMLNMVQRVRFRVVGHGIYFNSLGLGQDTITVDWLDAERKPFFLAGNWVLYGFWHVWVPGEWFTHLFAARIDWDALATSIPPKPFQPGQ